VSSAVAEGWKGKSILWAPTRPQLGPHGVTSRCPTRTFLEQTWQTRCDWCINRRNQACKPKSNKSGIKVSKWKL